MSVFYKIFNKLLPKPNVEMRTRVAFFLSAPGRFWIALACRMCRREYVYDIGTSEAIAGTIDAMQHGSTRRLKLAILEDFITRAANATREGSLPETLTAQLQMTAFMIDLTRKMNQSGASSGDAPAPQEDGTEAGPQEHEHNNEPPIRSKKGI